MISGEIQNANSRVISLGAGVQSSVMALMAAKGELRPMPEAAIFADTQWEPKDVYEHLDWLEKQLPFPVYRVSEGNIKDHALAGKNKRGTNFVTMPFFTKHGIGRRQCTNDYKLEPIRKKIRDVMGLKPRQRAKDLICESWIGISLDEMQRIKESRDYYIKHRWPLIEKRMSRRDCLKWFDTHYPGRKLAKSACIGCPYHSNDLWRDMRKNDPESFQEAIDFDKKIRKANQKDLDQYVHQTLKPLDEVDFDTLEDKGQLSFLDECDGMCGV